MQDLQTLLICRNAYWKMAGEQMGFGKSWEPNWTTTECMQQFLDLDTILYVILLKINIVY